MAGTPAAGHGEADTAHDSVDAVSAGAVLHLTVPFARQRPRWLVQRWTLDRLTILDDFEQYVADEKPELFGHYRDSADLLRDQFADTMTHFGVGLAGRRLLDIGPGFGEALEVAHRQGASSCDFVELDPVFYAWNRLRGFAGGHRFNHATSLGRLRPAQFDVVWARGSVVADQFAAAPRLHARWLRDVDSLVAPGGVALVCPYWHYRWTDDDDGLQRFLPDVRRNPFTETMRAAGWRMVESPSERIGPVAYPVVFEKRY